MSRAPALALWFPSHPLSGLSLLVYNMGVPTVPSWQGWGGAGQRRERTSGGLSRCDGSPEAGHLSLYSSPLCHFLLMAKGN